MTKPIAYPAVVNPAYSHRVSRLRVDLNHLGTFVGQSPKSKPDIGAQIEAFCDAYDVPVNELPSTDAVVSDEQSLTFNGVVYTFVVEDGVVTDIQTAPE